MKTKTFAVLLIASVLLALTVSAGIAQGEECVGCEENAQYKGIRQLPKNEPQYLLASAPGYCPSYGGSHSYEFISSVSYTQNPSGTMTITVDIYIANPTGCTYGNPCPEYDNSPEYVNVWVDWDGDKVFESGEKAIDAALTGYSSLNYHGTMTTSKIVTIPPGAVSSTWMRTNLGWGHDPNDPCEQYWTWGDIKDKPVEIALEPPKIEEITIKGPAGDEKNPTTTLDNTLEAKISDAPGYEVESVSCSFDIPVGNIHILQESGNNLWTKTIKFAAGMNGNRQVECQLVYKNTATGEIGMSDPKTKDFKLFFVKTEDEDNNGVDNWYEYWSTSDNAACSFDKTSATYNYGGGSYSGNQYGEYNGNPSNPVYTTFNRATMHESYNCPSAGLNIDRKGIDCAEATLAHEREHRNTDAKWLPGGEWHGKADSDNDELPDDWENSNSGFEANNRYSFSGFPYGDDEEVWVEMVAESAKGTATNDWANPGKQSDPEYKRIIVETGTAATLTDNYADYGKDTNGNGLYDYLTVEVEVNVVAAGTYTVFGNLYDTNDNMLWAENFIYLDTGTQYVELNFDGSKIRQRRVDGPYTLRHLTLFGSYDVTDEIQNPYITSAYDYTAFEGPETEFTGTYSDYGTDTDGDGLYNFLTIDVEVNTVTPGDYTVEGWLYDSSGNAIIMASDCTYLNAGSQSVSLNFDGLTINRHRVDGPYHLKYLSLSGSGQIDFIYDAYTTSAYSYTEFQKKGAGFTGSYTDYGKDTDGDGLYNYLTIDVGVDVTVAGKYILMGWLYDGDGNDIVWASSDFVSLNTGVQSLELNFGGLGIYSHGVDGPYNLKNIMLFAEGGSCVDYIRDAYTTSAYNYEDFQSLIALAGNYNDYGTDTDGDGLYDYLTVDVEVILANAGNVVASARLMDSSGEEIIWATNTAWLDADLPQNIQLNFDGRYVYGNMVDGPYYVRDVYVYHTGDPTLPDYVHDAHTTAAYSYTEFEESGVISGTVTDAATPVQNAYISLSGGDFDYTNAAGEYNLVVLQAGTYEVNIEATGYDSWKIYVNSEFVTDGNSVDVSASIGEVTYVDFTQEAAPVADSNGPYAGNEGSEITFDASGSYDPDGSIVLYEWDFDGDGIYDVSNESSTAIFTWGDDHTGNVELRVTDNGGLSGTDTANITVNNVAPTAFFYVEQPEDFILPYHSLTFNGASTDAGWLDVHAATWDFGDGTIVSGTLTEENDQPDATGTTTAEHAYVEPGEYTVTLTVTDDDGGVGDYTTTVTVISAEEATEIIIDQLEVSIVPLEAPKGVSQKIESAIDKLEQVIDFLGQGKYCDAIGKLDGVIIQIEGAIDQMNEQRCSIKECKGKECICIADEDANELIESLEQAKQGAIAIWDLISKEHPECAYMV